MADRSGESVEASLDQRIHHCMVAHLASEHQRRVEGVQSGVRCEQCCDHRGVPVAGRDSQRGQLGPADL